MRSLWIIPVLVLIAGPAAAAWPEDLTRQLEWEHDCEVEFLSGVIEREVEGAALVIAKAHCEDGRVFDALRRGELDDFELNECTPVEQAC